MGPKYHILFTFRKSDVSKIGRMTAFGPEGPLYFFDFAIFCVNMLTLYIVRIFFFSTLFLYKAVMLS